MTMTPATQTISEARGVPAEAAAGVLKLTGVGPSAGGSQTHVRIAEHVAEQGAQRIGTMAILTAVTVVATSILQHALQPELVAAEQAPLYRLSALFLVLAAVGVAALQRAQLVSPQDLLDVGLVFELAGACALALMENAMPWPDSPVRGSTAVAAWIAICVVVIPNRPWKSIVAAIASAAVVPCAHLVAAQIAGYPPLSWNRLLSYALGPALVAAWTPFTSTRLHRLHEDLSRSQDFGSYTLEKLLGRGGMGEVWLARHRFLRREAAVKLVLAGLLERSGASERRSIQKRFESEAQAIASLRSPHTVAIYDYGLAENGSLYYAMEYLHGLDAQTLVDQYGPQPAGRVICVFAASVRIAGRGPRRRPGSSRYQRQQSFHLPAWETRRFCKSAGFRPGQRSGRRDTHRTYPERGRRNSCLHGAGTGARRNSRRTRRHLRPRLSRSFPAHRDGSLR